MLIQSTQHAWRRAGVHVALLAFMAFLLFPLVWVFATSFKPTPEIYAGAGRLLPQQVSLEHYRAITTGSNLLLSMRNSLQAGLLATLLAVVLALPGAYALARFRSALNQTIVGWILTSQIFPAILVMIPLYVLLRNLRLTDSLFGLALVYVVWALPFVLWMLHGYLKSIPVDLEEAAAIDGATRPQIIFRVILPTLLPALAAAMLFTFISAWNEFFFALVLMKSPDTVTLPVELARYTGMEGQARTGPLAAASVLATLPSLLLFGLLQKWFAGGLLAGAVKN
ncbi:MAG: Trehalose transport system permease protein SugB [bacterium]|nr:Trehalose transport system permease protein SugB [bacterium]MCK6562930.1 carbohydrate ABC transporter permease [bacterium]NUM65578.1 carbohydrate ABC transporter permease [candidate division KSB1 bacterium]